MSSIFTPRQRNEAATRVAGQQEDQHQHFNTNQVATRVTLPTINEDEIGTKIRKNYNNTIQRGEVTHYNKNEKLYYITYDSGDNEQVTQIV